jgi:hypothetical protein
MSRLVVRGAVMVMPGSTVIWLVSASTGDLDGLARVGQADLDLLVNRRSIPGADLVPRSTSV